MLLLLPLGHISNTMPPGVMGHLPENSCTLRGRPVSRPSNLHYKGSCVNAVQPGARRSVADVTKASADTTTSSAHNYSRVVG